ncbi:hypothetical protein [Thalassospira sp. UBA4513]|uniref:hypothetical protein n=1 Tax=Thalassospira sp. UBA4513 TaxID=1947675 RepID=UPI00257EB139|nr:hypothetical protein [Thalassospira sp. UBA4513]
MVAYPMHVKRDYYRGAQPARKRKAQEYNRLAEILENYVNEEAQKVTNLPHVFLYADIARETNIPVKKVRDILFCLAAGHNGFTLSHR